MAMFHHTRHSTNNDTILRNPNNTSNGTLPEFICLQVNYDFMVLVFIVPLVLVYLIWDKVYLSYFYPESKKRPIPRFHNLAAFFSAEAIILVMLVHFLWGVIHKA